MNDLYEVKGIYILSPLLLWIESLTLLLDVYVHYELRHISCALYKLFIIKIEYLGHPRSNNFTWSFKIVCPKKHSSEKNGKKGG